MKSIKLVEIYLFSLFAAIVFFSVKSHAQRGLDGARVIPIVVVDATLPDVVHHQEEIIATVDGTLRNGCATPINALMSRPDNNKDGPIEVRTFGIVPKNICTAVMQPFRRDVRLGKLPSGQYLLKFINPDGTTLERRLNVRDQ